MKKTGDLETIRSLKKDTQKKKSLADQGTNLKEKNKLPRAKSHR